MVCNYSEINNYAKQRHSYLMVKSNLNIKKKRTSKRKKDTK